MATLVCIWGSARPDAGTAPLEKWAALSSIKSLNARRLGLIVVFAFCAITGARPVTAGSVQQSMSERQGQEWATPE